ncbi:tricarballylate utilization 4Fe-4S protein TcuB [Propylenella binzhouense]|uniref:Tricarballylate utilization 4Fe-4S protein TcuB n=1 Tax=Propylenella binzhouense TaxID=2555902 RepID=A0A964T243_9HYPH|nr:tricarballylate utilization 4Fe-4S protein TcuB [Propylenella binzhouense]MYZ46993.1 tricarballylate utilization 4Fe-4S protein TcuB [Propylenella binzhouense]
MYATDTQQEADRIMTICNACRYCEGLCAVFPAMEMRRAFTPGDLNYFANLCHACGACYYDCQFSPPHEFSVDVPQTLAKLRGETYQAYAWPRAFAGVFARNGLAISLIAALSVAVFILGFVAANDPSVVFATQTGAGAFYRLMPHNWMVAIFGAAFIYAIVALVMGFRNFWRDIGEPSHPLDDGGSIWQAVKDAASLRYLDGGGMGCMNDSPRPKDGRRHAHHATFYGFMLCFASTCIATLYHYFLGREAPYPWYDLPVVLGTLGGIGLVVGPIGLYIAKRRRDPAMVDHTKTGMDVAFIAMLFLTGLTGLLLLLLRATPAMGILLAVHLGVVFSLFVTMPYGKFVHGIYRFAALVRYAKERRAHEAPPKAAAPAGARPVANPG